MIACEVHLIRLRRAAGRRCHLLHSTSLLHGTTVLNMTEKRSCPSKVENGQSSIEGSFEVRLVKPFCLSHSWWTRAIKCFSRTRAEFWVLLETVCHWFELEERSDFQRGCSVIRLHVPAHFPSQRNPVQFPRVCRLSKGPATKEERDRHFLTHLPPAPWCPVCVQARSGDAMHHVQLRDELFDPARPHCDPDGLHVW